MGLSMGGRGGGEACISVRRGSEEKEPAFTGKMLTSREKVYGIQEASVR